MADRITVFGAGSWGTALAVSLARAGHEVQLWARRAAAADCMRQTRRNPDYLPDIDLPGEIEITSNLKEAAARASCWVIATPSHAVRAIARQLRPHGRDLVLVSVAKGIENDTLMTTTQVMEEELGGVVPPARMGVLYGPSHAEEVAHGRPTAVVAAAREEATAEAIQNTFMTDRLRVYVNMDLIGVEVGGSAKNVLAIAAGISDGLGYGDNSKAALVTRGIAEIKRLALLMGASASTFAGLAGIGDVVVTCMSRHSRNRYLGEQIGKGKTLAQVEEEMTMVAEGVRTTRSVHAMAQQHGIEMPITEAVYAVLFEGMNPMAAVDALMTRSAKREDWLPDALQE